MAELTITKDRQELERLEGIIERNLQSFYEVGRALMEIRDKGYYRDVLGFETFEAYCREKWDFNRAHAYRLIDSAMVIETVSPMGDKKPENERQARPLARLEPDKQREAWQKAVETAPEGKVTAAHVQKVVKEYQLKGEEGERGGTDAEPPACGEDSFVLSELKRLWKRATKKERSVFQDWIEGGLK